MILPIAGTTSAPPYRRSKFRIGSCSSLSQVKHSAAKLFLPIVGSHSAAEIFLPIKGTNPAEEIVPPYSRYYFRSSLKQEPFPLRKVFLLIAGTNCTERLLLPIAGSNHAAEIVPPYCSYKSRCGNCSSISQVQILQRKVFLPIAGTNPSGNCSSLLQLQIPLRKLILPIAGTTSAPPYRRSKFRCGSCSPFCRYKFRS